DDVAGGRRAEAAQKPAAQVRNLSRDDAPVPAVRPIQIRDLGGRVLGAEVAAERVELQGGGQQVIAEHVAKLKRDAAAYCRAETIGAHAHGRLCDAFERERWIVCGRRICRGRRQTENGVGHQRRDVVLPAVEGRQRGGRRRRRGQRRGRLVRSQRVDVVFAALVH